MSNSIESLGRNLNIIYYLYDIYLLITLLYIKIDKINREYYNINYRLSIILIKYLNNSIAFLDFLKYDNYNYFEI